MAGVGMATVDRVLNDEVAFTLHQHARLTIDLMLRHPKLAINRVGIRRIKSYVGCGSQKIGCEVGGVSP
ncbi:hypothetical protein [Pantoea sp. AS142]|uniref:hypothetical protein n=1 Tax=Pantoea sp. AS142 TaxID=3081292 RepID=UPI003019127A